MGRALRQRRFLQGGTPIELTDGERLQQVNFRLRLGGTISGRILDADDRPVALAQAQALRPQFQDGERVLVALGTALSNSRGEFRILSLPPGDYYLSAFDPAAQGTVGESGELQYAPTFYPAIQVPSRRPTPAGFGWRPRARCRAVFAVHRSGHGERAHGE